MVFIGELASFFVIAAMMGRRSAEEEGGSFLDLLYCGRISDGDLDLALRLSGEEDLLLGVEEDLLLGVEEGEERGVESSV
jgi:hypothetical protein